MLAALATVFICALAVQASVVPRATPNCVRIHSGYLSATVNGTLHAFTTLSNGKLTYTGNGKSPLRVTYQACLPPGETLGTGGGGLEYIGRLYVPSLKKCVAISNKSSPKPPYYPQINACAEHGPDVLPVDAQTWNYRTSDSSAIRWAGKSYSLNATAQGACDIGLLGYVASSTGAPKLTSGMQIELECYANSVPFKLSTKAN